MMRPSVQVRLCFGLSALAVAFAAGWAVVAGAEVVVAAGVAAAGVAVAAGAVSETAGGRSRYFGASVAGAASLTCVGALAVAVVCGAAACSFTADSDRLRGPAAWADAEARTMAAATRMILRISTLPVFGV